MKTILIPTDYSATAMNAAKYGMHMARHAHAKVVLMHAYHVPVLPLHEMPFVDITPESLQASHEEELRKLATSLNEHADVEIEIKAVMGFTVDVLCEMEKEVSMVVMGNRGADKKDDSLFGSITMTYMRKAKIPVLIIPETAQYKKPENIVFACDFNPETNVQTLESLKQLLAAFDASILVLNVKPAVQEVTIEESIAGVKLEGTLTKLEHYYYFADNEDPIEGINDFVQLKQADMLAIIPHHYNLIENLFHRSVSKELLLHTHVPLLSIPEVPSYTDRYEA